MKTRVTELLKTKYPIIQGGMQWVGRAELASAVSNAGGLGILTALTQASPKALSEEIARCRLMTDKPFGVNLTILPTTAPPPYEEYLDAALQSGVKVIETAGRSPKEFIEKIKAAGAVVVHKCTAVRHALSAERAGVDAISIDGFEAAGHPGEDDIGGLVLFAAAAMQVKIPLIASGGIGTGEGMAAAFMLGAEGVNMGTRFCATKEAPIHEHIKQALVNAGERDTNLIFRTFRNTGRVLKNAISDEVVAIEGRPGGAEFTDVRPLVSGERGRHALTTGELDSGLVWASQTLGLIKDIPSCQELIERIVSDCHLAMTRGLHAFSN
ncbi:nitronate monooxygenase [Ochrobactrum sp. MYb15]|uniref:Nitronate monooxygenase n=1 Tax=Brucella pituitosa TaxID=571256 RepID=A0A643ESZ0_9HYPH|nr:nitronate monooxygenase [Brucella pituitosa]PQZ45971.1 nitronate monooxygenase [Ochrobactrum sp. MYb19]PRA60237.1 nitronate monooxygenase [Ochrobactrum sp. MYb18]PRA73553.1 nitronate monooxygenase [Brucella thiophenivorans]PRA84449.1 nitronate monooxygenase [Ochrobactrum sp. MYb14]PRA94609.1 nitronate monooxygenase [Ochrobactrum sp. MYb15]